MPTTPFALEELLRFFAPVWDGAGLTPAERAQVEFAARRYPPILEFMALHPPRPTDKVLDVGGGLGSLSTAFHRSFGGRYDVAEFAPPTPPVQAALRSRGIERWFAVRLDRPRPLEGLDTDYDLLLFVEVLEHLLVNPRLLVRDLASHLRPGGRLLITTPNQARLRNRLALLFGRSVREAGDQFPPDDTPRFGHVLEYTRRDVDRICRGERLTLADHRVVQNPPRPANPRWIQFGVRLLNTAPARGLGIGDDLLLLYSKPP